MSAGNNSHEATKGGIATVVLFLTVIIGGVLIAFLGDNKNDLHRYSFVVLISLGAGLGATYLTGKIIGSGKFGFLSIKSATGGFLIWLITLATFIYFFPKPSETKNVPIMNGKWLYVCTDGNEKYQHGGRFIATQIGSEWTLKGERMWKDVIDSLDKWHCSTYNPTKSWFSTWGGIDENKIRCRYIIENINDENIDGYFEGDIKKVDEHNNITEIKGKFYQLYPSKQISGEIAFIKVADDVYENPSWTKNHKCVE